MQERVHKLSVRKTVRQTQATHLHPWFKLLFQQGTEPNCASCIWSLHLLRSSAPGELSSHRSSCACHSGLPSQPPGLGQTWEPPSCALQHELDVPLPLSGTAEQKLCWEQWPDCRAVGRCCLSCLLPDLKASCIAPAVGWCKHSLRAWQLRVQTCSSKKPCVWSPSLLRQSASLKQEHWVPSKLLSRFHSWKAPAFFLHHLS